MARTKKRAHLTPGLFLRVEPDMLEWVRRYAEREDILQSQALRRLLRKGREALELEGAR